MRPIPIILTILLALGAVEGVAYWWMHPAPAGLGQPVLVYQPGVGLDRRSAHVSPSARDDKEQAIEDSSQEPGASSQREAQDPAQSSSSIQNSTSKIQNSAAGASSSSAALGDLGALAVQTSFTPLPDLVSRSIPSLRCSTGTAARIDREDGVTVHVAFFEWDLASSNNVLEAFLHLPEQCMGSIGLTLFEIRPPRTYKIGDETLSFDHTVFRDPAGRPVHAFKGVWVSGAANLLGDGLRGGVEQWRQIRWQAALKRFRPAHARVAQGAILGIANSDRAWEIFEKSMLRDLTFER